MASNVRKQAAGVGGSRVDETSVAKNVATGTVDVVDAKDGGDAPRRPNPWPVELGWDFPFDFPKRAQ
jgi:hypothetical protein